MGMNRILLPDLYSSLRDTHWLHDDFDFFETAKVWTALAADTTATVTCVDNQDGQVLLTTDATDNNEAAIFSTRKNFLIAANKPCMYESRINFAEAATNAANVAAGFSTVFAANLMLDNGAGPATTMDGALIYKQDGETVWRCLSSIGTTQTKTVSTKTAGGTADQVLRIEINPINSTQAEVTFYVDGVPLMDASQTARNMPIKHTITYTGAAKMGVGVYAKCGSAANQPVNIDYIFAAQKRT